MAAVGTLTDGGRNHDMCSLPLQSPHLLSCIRPTCTLTDRIPVEIRNRIYELVYAPDDDFPGTVELFSKTPVSDADNVLVYHNMGPPNKHLLLTCRQILSEARAMYKYYYRSFWKNTNFSIDLNHEWNSGTCDIARSKLHSLREQDLKNITRLRFSVRDAQWRLFQKNGPWYLHRRTWVQYLVFSRYLTGGSLPVEEYYSKEEAVNANELARIDGTLFSMKEQIDYLVVEGCKYGKCDE